MHSTTMTIRLETEMKARLDKIAEITHRSKSFLAAEAINEYLRVQEWQLMEIKKGIAEADESQLEDHESILSLWENKGKVRIKWTKGAKNNLNQIEEYISRDNPKAAVDTVIKIIKIVGLLSNNPSMGRTGRVFGTRELIISGTSFIVPYRIKSEQVEILRVLHSSIKWPDFI